MESQLQTIRNSRVLESTIRSFSSCVVLDVEIIIVKILCFLSEVTTAKLKQSNKSQNFTISNIFNAFNFIGMNIYCQKFSLVGSQDHVCSSCSNKATSRFMIFDRKRQNLSLTGRVPNSDVLKARR
eukprot:GHVP01007428.1.p1 GENE.GHVP01007428.1~~GHVP01007428.1.p1  ORF type:complete len:126 (-),score=11.88 GHVP01007428.1:215-592(-)